MCIMGDMGEFANVITKINIFELSFCVGVIQVPLVDRTSGSTNLGMLSKCINIITATPKLPRFLFPVDKTLKTIATPNPYPERET